MGWLVTSRGRWCRAPARWSAPALAPPPGVRGTLRLAAKEVDGCEQAKLQESGRYAATAGGSSLVGVLSEISSSPPTWRWRRSCSMRPGQWTPPQTPHWRYQYIYTHTMHTESSQTLSSFPRFVMSQTPLKMDSMNVFFLINLHKDCFLECFVNFPKNKRLK